MKYLKTFEGNVAWGVEGHPIRRKKTNPRLEELEIACKDAFAELIDDGICYVDFGWSGTSVDKEIMIGLDDINAAGSIHIIKGENIMDRFKRYIKSYHDHTETLKDVEVALLRIMDEFPDVIIKTDKPQHDEEFSYFALSFPKISKKKNNI